MMHNGRLKPARKVIKCPEGDLRISKRGMAAAVTFRKMILSVPVVQPNGVAKEATEAAYRRGDLLEKRKQLMEEWARYALSGCKAT